MSSPVLIQRRLGFTEDNDNDSNSPAPADLAGHLSRSASAPVITTMTNAKPRLNTPGPTYTAAVAAAAAAAVTMTANAAASSSAATNSSEEDSDNSRLGQLEQEPQARRRGEQILYSDTDESHTTDEEEEEDEDEERQTIGSERTVVDPYRGQRVWEADQQASECRRCGRRFNFLVRRHHCRRCGQVVCDRCSTHRIRLPMDEIIQDPMTDPSHYAFIAMHPQRVCTACIRPIAKRATSPPPHPPSAMSSIHYSRSNGVSMRRSDSTQSLMTECPVCGTGFLGTRKTEQERHLQVCLNKGSPPAQPIRYVVYELSRDSTQINDECPICFEDFTAGDKIARMICLCSYHQRCLCHWLSRGKGCPVHYDDSLPIT